MGKDESAYSEKKARDYLDMWLLLKELEFRDFEKLAEKKLAVMNDNIDMVKFLLIWIS